VDPDQHADEHIAPLERRQPLVDQLTAGILTYIRTNKLTAGTKLPGTAAMAKSFGVSASTLREGLRRLETTGVLEVRHGVGIFVKSGALRLLLVNPDRADPDPDQLSSLVEARQLIEPTLAGRAAHRRTDEDVAELGRLLAESAEHMSDREKAGSRNLRFHSYITQIAGNRVLSEMMTALLELHTEDQLVIDRLFDDPERDHRDHVDIYNAIRAGDAALAQELMKQHLNAVLASVVRNRPAGSSRPEGH
jgi:GntR family transcriptional regulator, transcriptional repressor for pyruvate dehydrogenase complex